MSKRIIIIDDELDYCRLIQQSFIGVLGYRADYTQSADEMYEMIRQAEVAGDPYEIATVDMDFKIPNTNEEFPQGNEILATLKKEFPYIMCIMVSGKVTDPARILMMRDIQGLDFFVPKLKLDPMYFKMYVQHVLEYRSELVPAPPTNDDETPTDQPSVFISYRRQNTWGKARAIANSLENAGVDVFLDVDSIGGGAFPPYIHKAIINKDYFMPLLSPGTLESEWVQKEIRFAIEMEKTIIPVLLDEFDFSPETIPDEFSRLLTFNGIKITPKTYKGDIERLVSQYLQV